MMYWEGLGPIACTLRIIIIHNSFILDFGYVYKIMYYEWLTYMMGVTTLKLPTMSHIYTMILCDLIGWIELVYTLDKIR